MDMDDDMAGGFCSGTGRVMMPGFSLAANGGPCVKYLFYNAVVDTPTKYAFAVLGTVVLGMLVEMIRWFRSHLQQRNFSFAKCWSDSNMDLVTVVLYMAQMTAAYWLMLLVMLYEYVLFIAIILGLGAGLLLTRKLDRKYFPTSSHATASGTPCCDGGASYVVPGDDDTEVVVDKPTKPCCAGKDNSTSSTALIPEKRKDGEVTVNGTFSSC
eukprot:m.365033 g.365033  ORF g.365033 m.365033 type:complete len:212 (-) comp29670_c0_seq1:395-1030(-)